MTPAQTARWLVELADYWNKEIPMRLHSRDTDGGGAPAWHGEFAHWLTGTDLNDDRWRRNPEPRLRTTRAMRKLRQQHPREFEVLYRTIILGIPLTETCNWLNDRAARNKKKERYTLEGVYLYIFVAAERVHQWW